ncbi:MAG TPA: hypothetical protein VFD31_01995 [Thermoleophilaceae bacterium]|nr:hypothetical protein [Thermoleophilaceae bacterium]
MARQPPGAAAGTVPIRGASQQVAVQIQHYIQRERLGPGDFLGRELLARKDHLLYLRDVLRVVQSGKGQP